MSDDLMRFSKEDGDDAGKSAMDRPLSWKVLITDDEQDVHSATAFALRNTNILGRGLEFLHAKSAAEAFRLLRDHDDIAVVLLDVVMETPNAGLDLVAKIRNELGNHEVRIILRTGQPNQAPEIEVIRDYDINDYKLKSELTQNKLYAALTTAIRSYQQIKVIESGRLGLMKMISACSDLMTRKGLSDFAEGVIIQLTALLSAPPEGLICVRRHGDQEQSETDIIAAAGHYRVLMEHPLIELDEDTVKKLILESLENQKNVFGESGAALYLGRTERGDMSCYVSGVSGVRDTERQLLEIFVNKFSVLVGHVHELETLRERAEKKH